MSGVTNGKTLAPENVPQVGTTGLAGDLRPTAIRVQAFLHRSWNRQVKTRPTTVSIELVVGLEERGVAASAVVDPGRVPIVIFARKRRFRPLVDDDPFLSHRQWMPGTRIPHDTVKLTKSVGVVKTPSLLARAI